MSSTQDFNCIFCKESFDNKEELQVHFRKHGDPNFNSSAKNKTRVQHEAQIPSEVNEKVSCDVCTEVFPTISKAITHKHKVHPDHDAKYFCPWCGKLFTMKHLYNKHLQTNHVDMWRSKDHNFHCDCCDVDFYVPTAMQYHNKFFHRQDAELPTIGLSKKVKTFNQETVQIYYCAFCGEEYNNKVNLYKHMCDDHSDENPAPENILRCPLCEATFYHLDAYELHLTFHSSEDLYSEENEMLKNITEFSLESVPPMMESVDSYESQDATECNINAIGIDNFLQLAMEESANNDITNNEQISEKTKTKKHKKHKKSKKSAITLDEFLSMNQDVFGEGLDFQGIEEVPTQVVAKQLKNKRPQGPSKAKVMVSDIEKLKKQGIVVKTKTGNKSFNSNNRQITSEVPLRTPVKVAQTNKLNKTTTPMKSNIINTSDDVLTKLINQSNNQIKIVKKSIQDNSDQMSSDPISSQLVDSNSSKSENLPEKVVEKQTENAAKYDDQEMVAKLEDSELTSQNIESLNTIQNNGKENLINENENLEITNSEIIEVQPPLEYVNTEEKVGDIDSPKANKEEESMNDNLTALRNISQHITVKSLSPKSVQCLIKQSHDTNKEELNDSQSRCEQNIENDNNENTGAKKDTQNNSLNALKHLSHLITVKSVTHTNYLSLHDKEETTFNSKKESQNLVHIEDVDNSEINKLIKTPEEMRSSTKSLDVLKNLNKNVVVNPFSQATKSAVSNISINNSNNSKDEFEGNVEEEINIKPVINRHLQLSDRIIKTKVRMPGSPERISQMNSSSKILNKPAYREQINKNNSFINENNEKSSNLIKHLPNLTAKPICTTNYKREDISTQSASTSKGHESNVCITKVEKSDEIEIFNIDDSDSEDDQKESSEDHQKDRIDSNTNLQKAIDFKNNSVKSIDALKNLSKFITVKSAAHNKSREVVLQGTSHLDESSEGNNKKTVITKENSQKSHANIALPNALKNISKHVTIKSRNSSPSLSMKSQDLDTQKATRELHDCNDSNSWSDNVKISELNNDDISDTEVNEENNKNVIVESPDESNSENECTQKGEAEERIVDIESEIKVNTLQKISHNLNKNSLCLDNIKNTNKGITIKSLNNKSEIKSIKNEVANSVNNELSVKSYKPGNLNTDDDESESQNKIPSMPIKPGNSRNVINPIIKQKVTSSANLPNKINQKIASSSSQINTANKEVTVKTFQTQTVIQEITTTVTKTIRTVNQTVKKEIQSAQNVCSPMIRTPQKVQGMRPNQIKNFQGMAVRHSSPNVGFKIRNAATPIRPAMGTPIKVSNQIVVRTPLNEARPCRPRMPAAKKIMPSTATRHIHAIGKPIKISPSAMNTPIKRTTGEEVNGPFSCFKKPKESLIPVSDIPVFTRDQDSDSTLHFASASHSSKTNFTSSSKVMKGSSVVTSTQMKRETSTSCQQQLNRLGNISGIKIVKASQAKQATQIVENSEVSATKRTTLEAIEKLQRHGLLVKKPRLETSDSDHSNVEDKDLEGLK